MKRKPRQEEFKPFNWGGKRKGAGRKPKGERAGVSHAKRQEFSARHPLFVTLRFRDGLSTLREWSAFEALKRAVIGANEREDFRIVELSAQSNHAHLIVEASGRRALSRAMNGLGRSLAHWLGVAWEHSGPVYADRYHDRVLKTPREVRNGLVYTLQNARKHGSWACLAPDPFSSGPQFDGWKDYQPADSSVRWLPRAQTWLLAVGWKRHGLISLREAPKPVRSVRA